MASISAARPAVAGCCSSICIVTPGEGWGGQASASAQEAALAASFARNLAERSEELRALGVEAGEAAELLRARERGSTALAEIRRLQVARTRAEQSERLATMRVELAHTAREEAALQRELAVREAAIATLEHQIGLHSLHAPIAGTLGGVEPLQPGAVLTRGSVVALVIPDGRLRVVASFTPAAVGRIRPGQPVRVRLTGFPWAEFGSLHGEVEAIASETQDGDIRKYEEIGTHPAANHNAISLAVAFKRAWNIAKDVQPGAVDVLGMAETATGLGHCVADHLEAPVYLHSTRRPAPPAHIRQLRSHLKEERAAVKRQDVSGRTRLLADFHVCLAECLGHRLLSDMLRDLTARTTLVASWSHTGPSHLRSTLVPSATMR